MFIFYKLHMLSNFAISIDIPFINGQKENGLQYIGISEAYQLNRWSHTFFIKHVHNFIDSTHVCKGCGALLAFAQNYKQRNHYN